MQDATANVIEEPIVILEDTKIFIAAKKLSKHFFAGPFRISDPLIEGFKSLDDEAGNRHDSKTMLIVGALNWEKIPFVKPLDDKTTKLRFVSCLHQFMVATYGCG